ncbi:hypothetical protein ARMSODRAFT_980738 [Armillaria solidipes]|uniref:Uncharacterized protein n=1 Tax=Armillaria solidipes TaxID=1076256 RepID=A0A2H3B615_9AGAR|nr:hypothetical protein ARMSODRAFT_980738 [Armillaria solidipes]
MDADQLDHTQWAADMPEEPILVETTQLEIVEHLILWIYPPEKKPTAWILTMASGILIAVAFAAKRPPNTGPIYKPGSIENQQKKKPPPLYGVRWGIDIVGSSERGVDSKVIQGKRGGHRDGERAPDDHAIGRRNGPYSRDPPLKEWEMHEFELYYSPTATRPAPMAVDMRSPGWAAWIGMGMGAILSGWAGAIGPQCGRRRREWMPCHSLYGAMGDSRACAEVRGGRGGMDVIRALGAAGCVQSI